ncbi:hypothetical protein ABPG72_001836 [Tetrahymena utriculariae]
MSNILKSQQQEQYQIANKYIGKNNKLQREELKKDVRNQTSTLSRTICTPLNSTIVSSVLNQQFLINPQTPQNQFRLKGSQTNLNSIVEQIKINPQSVRNGSLQSHYNNNANKQIEHRRLKQIDDGFKSNASQIAKSSNSFQKQQQQFVKEQSGMLQVASKEKSQTPFSNSKQPLHSMKSLLYLSQDQGSSRNLISSQTQISSIKGSNFNLQIATQKNKNGSLQNLDSAFVPKNSSQSQQQLSVNVESAQSLYDNFSHNYEWIDKIEGKQFQSATTIDPKEFLLLNKANKIKKKLINIISNSNINSQLAQDGILNVIRCDINEFIYFKIKIIERSTPLRVKFMVEKNSSNIKLYASKTCIQPNNFNCDYVFTNTKAISIDDEKNQSTFKKHQFLYFSLLSDQEQDIQIKYTFGQETKRLSNQDLQNRQSLTTIPNIVSLESINQLNFSKLKQIVIEIQQEKQQKMKEEGNFILKNIKFSKEIDQFTKALTVYSKKKETYNHIINVIKKAQETKEAKKEAIEQVQLAKIQKQIHKIKKFRLDFFTYFWFQFVNYFIHLNIYFQANFQKIYLAKISSMINSRFMEKKEVIKNFAKIAWKAHPLTMKFRTFYRQYPKDQDKTNLRYAKITMETLANIIKKKKRKEARHLIVRALRYNSQYSELWVRMNRYYQIVLTVQKNYKIFRIKKANFKKLLDKLWDKYYFMGMEQTIEVKKTEDSEQLFWRKKQNVLNTINSPDVKQYAINEYFKDQMIEFRQNIGNYLQMIRHAPKEQKNKIRILQAFLNSGELYKNSLIFEDGNKTDQLDVSFDNIGSEQDQNKIPTNTIKKPRLFVVPTFKSIKSVFRTGVIYYASQNQSIMEKISLKEI